MPEGLALQITDAGPATRTVELNLASRLDLVEEAVEVLARECLPSETRQSALFNFKVVTSEALANAIIYGHRQDAAKVVGVLVTTSEDEVRIEVRDQGSGFDPSVVPDPTTPERIFNPDGRGLFLIRKLVDEVTFNERGNSICMVLRGI